MVGRFFSLVIPVYQNEGSIPDLIEALVGIAGSLESAHDMRMEVVLVVDGSPDASHRLLAECIARTGLHAQLILHSRNFGSFAAIRTGLAAATGEFFGVMAADLQEPPALMLEFAAGLAEGEFDVLVGTRQSRADPLASRLASTIFWRAYRACVSPDMPVNGVDVFACNKLFRDHLLTLEEANSSLVGLIYWLGFRRGEVTYSRLPRLHGKSGWTFRKKYRYLLDSVFSFTDLPIRLLTMFGLVGLLVSVPLGLAAVIARLSGLIDVPGYAATIVAVAFFGAINALGLGVIGSYAWRTYENTKRRPLSLVASHLRFAGGEASAVSVSARPPRGG